MYLPLDFNSGVPIYRQIVNTVRYYIATGRLLAGEQVPSIRELCAKLRVNPATVNRAFRELEASGYLETRRGLGTFVADTPPKLNLTDAQEVLAEKVLALLTEAYRLGLSSDDLIEITERLAASLDAKRASREDESRS